MSKPRFHREALIREFPPLVYQVVNRASSRGSYRSLLEDWHSRTGCRHWLLSFMDHRVSSTFHKELIHHGGRVFLDSGAYSLQRRPMPLLKQEAYIQRYVHFCRQEGSSLDCYANLDHRPDSTLCYQMQKRLEQTGIFPFPVIHGDRLGLEYLQRYIDEGYKFIGVSPSHFWKSRYEMDAFLNRVFHIAEKHDVFLHGFAITDPELMFRFPFYSCDSRTALMETALGRVLAIRNHRLLHVRVSEYRGVITSLDKDYAKEWIESHGRFDFDMMCHFGSNKMMNRRAWTERAYWNLFVMAHLYELGARPTRGRLPKRPSKPSWG
jgi:hypothetical protein